MRVLIMGLPGSGKTTLAAELRDECENAILSVAWFNADAIRTYARDWDFSQEGRMRQARRMRLLADESGCTVNIIDMVAARPEQRVRLDADITVWMDTIKVGRFADTNLAFIPPLHADFVFKTQTDDNVKKLMEAINNAVHI